MKCKKANKDTGQRVFELDVEDHLQGVCIKGPHESPQEGGQFNLTQQQPPNQPMDPPRVQFQTEMWHPNVQEGNICLNILKQGTKDSWSPIMKIEQVLISIQQLLSDPNPDDPLNNAAAEQYKSNRAEFTKKAREYTQKWARLEDCETQDW